MPFGPECEYATFEDCVRAHKGKKDPEAYCATIMRATEEHCKKNQQWEVELRARDTQITSRPIGRRPWTWDIDNSRYVDADGNILPYEDLRQLLYRFLEGQRSRAEAITNQMFDRVAGVTVPEWEAEMRSIIKDAYGAAYMLGRGGRYQMNYRDWGYLGRQVSEQYRYLNNFAAQVTAGSVDEGRAVMRANLYPLSARQVMQRGYTYARGAPDLPAYPGDGSTECLGNCGCHWDLEETTLGTGVPGWNCRWVRGKSDSCATCVRRENDWNPLRLPARG